MEEEQPEEEYDGRVLFPRWRKHARPRLQIVRVFLDAQGYLLFADKGIHRESMYKHAWTNLVNQNHVLPDRKKAETFETYRNLSYFVIGGVSVKWTSRKIAPEITWFEDASALISAFENNPDLFSLSAEPETRKRNAWFLFMQPKHDVKLAITDRFRKRKFQMKSSLRVRKNDVNSPVGFTTKRGSHRKPRVQIFGPRDPLNKESEREFLQQKKSRKEMKSSSKAAELN